MRLILLFFLISLSSAFAEGQIGIRKTDFQNFTYQPFCADVESFPVKVVNGEFLRRGTDSAFDYLHFWVTSVEYGDLDGDSKDEAIVITVCQPGGTGKFSEGYIFSEFQDNPKLVGRFPGGDRAAGGLVSARVSNGFLVVERNEEIGGGLCCPNFTMTRKYRFTKGILEQAGEGIRKELYPPKRIQSLESGKSIVLSETIDYLQRFVISGNEGKILSVTTDLESAPINLFMSGEHIDAGVNGLKARFRPNEDIVFGVHNNESFPRLFTITLRIDSSPNSYWSSQFLYGETNLKFPASTFSYETFINCFICGSFGI